MYNQKENDKKRKRASLDIQHLVYGKVPPQAKGIERQLLGIIMVVAQYNQDAYNAVINEVRRFLKPEDFYLESHQKVFAAMLDLDANGAAPEATAVVEQLTREEELETIGGSYYVFSLTNDAVSHTNVKKYCEFIKQYSVARKLISFSGNVINEAYDGVDPFAILRDAEQMFYEINKEIDERHVVDNSIIAFNLLNSVVNAKKLTPEEREQKYLYTGMKEWDKINGPLFCGGVYVVAARPAMGKTAHTIQLLINMSKKYPVGIINVEMTNDQLVKRICSNLKEINNDLYKKEVEDWTEDEKRLFHAGIQEFVKLHLFIESDTTDIDKIIQRIKFWVRSHGVRAVAIDYLQILQVAEELAKYMTDVQALNYILEKIRATAKQLDIPIFLLSQLNRELYRRAGNKEPNLGDLKGSGKIEEIAFQISFLHRPEYYEPDLQVDELGESIKGLCYQIIAKHRDGKIDKVKHRFRGQYTKFEDWESDIMPYTPVEIENVAKDDLPF